MQPSWPRSTTHISHIIISASVFFVKTISSWFYLFSLKRLCTPDPPLSERIASVAVLLLHNNLRITFVLPLAEDAVNHSAPTGSTQVGEEVTDNSSEKTRATETGSSSHLCFLWTWKCTESFDEQTYWTSLNSIFYYFQTASLHLNKKKSNFGCSTNQNIIQLHV